MAESISDEEALVELRQVSVDLLEKIQAQLKITSMNQLCGMLVNKLTKDKIVPLFTNCLGLLSEYVACTSDYSNSTSSMKTELIESQKSVIKLQSELLKCKESQLNSLKDEVKETVENSVKTEFQTYSSVVENSRVQEQVICPEILKRAVQTAVQEEDRSKNVMIFGLPELANQELNSTVGEMFEAIGEKPRVEACRVGKHRSEKGARPVKATFSSSTVVENILAKVKRLKNTDRYKTVFVCPDRTLEMRIKQRELVKELKRKVADETGKRHFIKSGKIISVDKD